MTPVGYRVLLRRDKINADNVIKILKNINFKIITW